ncbi:glycosyltransferase [Macrococcus armenti]|uniref:glycosyltransferase n=1 Tax=Macrococcus armenti TaxID=2875764 RepID=UPI001CCA0942|nr:glycosyltransferase [Macrococcus armenti]UBH16501.1 CDP-glycerol glycerophosphotransferase family protein [Macrococcus armenti]UBH18857.1 CDP-glycerol glycerophosphotransferase family protein [Macrococcus armenti]UBH21134.1 CDP-glycerol glycerophosphotransferase family protein [Macrococcus armenti]
MKRKIKFINEPIKMKRKSKYTSKVMKYAVYYKKNKIDENQILYQSRDGKSMTDSPLAIFEYLIADDKFSKYKHVWVADSKERLLEFKHNYGHLNNVEFVIKETKEYLKNLTTAKYLFNNSTFPYYFTKKKDQVYINTWHGTPLKYMGLDIPNSLKGSQNIIKNFLSSDYIITQNKHTTEVFKRAFKLEGLYDGEILELGYPRMDNTIISNKYEIFNSLKMCNIVLKHDKKIALFCPTWRGTDVNNPLDVIDEYVTTITELEKSTEYQILLKLHPFLYDKVKDDIRIAKYIIPDAFDTNKLLKIVDLMITDYSSIYFDFLVTGNPVIFFTTDYDEYSTSRGLYIETEKLPGPVVKTTDELIHAIKTKQFSEKRILDNYQNHVNKYLSNDDGNVTEKLVSIVFGDEICTINNENKKKILMYPGGMINNGITSACKNLLEHIDYNKYDVTIFINNTNNPIVLNNLEEVNPNVRVILRSGPLQSTLLEYYLNSMVRNRGLISKFEQKLYPNKLYEREMRKIFGNSKFDYVIDYSGYAMFWSNLLLSTNAKRKIVYMHSDILSDMNRTVNGRRPHYQNLKGVVSLYPQFDKIVGVSEATTKLNKESINDETLSDKFTSAMNTINVKKINKLKNENDVIFEQNGEKYILKIANNSIEKVPYCENDYKLITMGRLSPEKGFDLLIDSMVEVVKNRPDAKLYILGDGPLKNQLENQIKSLSLENNVFLLGQRSNPFYLMQLCDLFVLPSHYEGQSMVLLEAMTLGMNVLASNIVANNYVLDDGKYGMLVENTSELLSEGIIKFISNDVPQYQSFDVETFNQKAINEFYSLFD